MVTRSLDVVHFLFADRVTTSAFEDGSFGDAHFPTVVVIDVVDFDTHIEDVARTAFAGACLVGHDDVATVE